MILARWDRACKCKELSEETLKELYPSVFEGVMLKPAIESASAMFVVVVVVVLLFTFFRW